MAEKPPDDNPWSKLLTISTFDKGNQSWSTQCDDESEVQNSGQVIGRVAPATSLLIESLVQQLCTVFEGDTTRRNKLYYAICDRLFEMKLIDGSYNKMEFEPMRGQYQVALYKLVTFARALTGSESSLQAPDCLPAECSRYHQEFNEIGFVAAGGFGNVFKAQHRLDGNTYAIKKIVVRSGRVKTIMKHLEEVKMIAKLDHTNIVSYKGAWIEPSYPETFVPDSAEGDSRADEKSLNSKNLSRKNTEGQNDSSDSGETSRSESESQGESNRSSDSPNNTYTTGMYRYKLGNSKKTTELRGSSGGYIISHDIINERFQQLNSTTNLIGPRISERLSSRQDDDGLSDVVSFRSDSRESRKVSSNGSTNCEKKSSTEDSSVENSDDSDSCDEAMSDLEVCSAELPSPPKYATLYIQMALCDQTLRQWLDERNEPTPINIVTSIFTQILHGLEYIHSLDIVHHDIKPSNIFISKSKSLQIQLGDFGLACPLQSEGRHSVLGTPTYAAPEQLNGICDPKSDVYSLGIILLEILVPTQTCMELSHVITALKKGQVPEALATSYPQWGQIILELVQENPEKRPSPTELLKYFNEDKDSIIARLKEENVKKDNLIHKLRDEIAQLEATIEKQRNSLGNT